MGAGIALLLALAAMVIRQRAVGVPQGQAGLSVLLITVDTLRADALGSYGRREAQTPVLDRLAAQGVRFEDAHAHNVLTLPSHANILSGRLPFDHGVRDNAGFRFPPTGETLATLLRARGYATGAFVSAFPLASRFGLDRGWDVYDDAFVGASARPVFLEQERPGTETVARARRWIEACAGRPFLAWVHVYEPHFPYEPPGPLASRFPGALAYHGEVAAADAALAPLLGPILDAGRDGRVLVVLTSDHGESLGEHGEATHGIFAYEATLRVPLLLHLPRLFPPRVVTGSARHIDLLPTILDALALPVPEPLPGRSLLGVATGQPGAPATTYFEALSGSLNRGWAPVRGVIRNATKYIDLPLPEVYDLAADPGELRNLAGTEPARLLALRPHLLPYVQDDAGPRPRSEDPEVRERLRSLGYVSGGGGAAKPRYTEEDDPKRLVDLDRMLEEVVALHREGRLTEARELCRQLVARRPSMLLSLLHLAQLERDLGHFGAAVATLRGALALDPSSSLTLALLGTALTQAGRADEAAKLLEPRTRAATGPDLELLLVRGLALARARRFAEALEELGRARGLEPDNGLVLVNEATVHVMKGDRATARRLLEDALVRNPETARAHSALALLAAEEGAATAAREHFSRAIALDRRECGGLPALLSLLTRGLSGSAARATVNGLVEALPPGRCEDERRRPGGVSSRN